MRVFRFLKRLIYRYIGRKRICVICDHHVGKFLPYRYGKRPPLMVALKTIGSDVNNFECPWCRCHDRERHLTLYLKKLELFKKLDGASVLHFAPEYWLSVFIERSRPKLYIRGDLYPSSPSIDKIDMLSIQYPDKLFDFVIANHVLEHVDNDLNALSEIRRVLKVGGYAILQTPFSSKLNVTFSDPGVDTDFARRQAYGQEDHVRLYGSDIVDRFKSVGFESLMATHDNVLDDTDAVRYGVNIDEPLFLFRRI